MNAGTDHCVTATVDAYQYSEMAGAAYYDKFVSTISQRRKTYDVNSVNKAKLEFVCLCGTVFQRTEIHHGWAGLRVLGIHAKDSTTNYIFIELLNAVGVVYHVQYPMMIKVHYDPDTSNCATFAMNTPMVATVITLDDVCRRGTYCYTQTFFYSLSSQAFFYMGHGTLYDFENAAG